jgi:hypothetical protein
MFDKFYYRLKNVFFDVPARNNLVVKDSDIFLVSYPRSGNTWLRFLLGTYMSGVKVDWLNIENIFPDIYRNTEKQLKRVPTPRLIKSHHPYDSRYKKVIYIVRDPRDVLISYYNWHLKFNYFEDNNENFNIFFEKFLRGDIRDFKSWSKNVESWLIASERDPKSISIFKYEDLKSDSRQGLIRILNFLEVEIFENEIEASLNWTSLANMRKLEEVQSEKSELLNGTNSTRRFVGLGGENNWENRLSSEQLYRLNTIFKEMMLRFEYV